MPPPDTDTRITLSKAQRSIVFGRIRSARSWANERQQIQDDDAGHFATRSERNLALVEGRYWWKRNETSMRQINYLRVALEIKHALMTSGDTEFIPTARDDRFGDLADGAKAYLNAQWDACECDRETDKGAWDAMIHPTGGIAELGWRYKDSHFDVEGMRPQESEIIDAETKDGNIPGMEPLMTGTGQMLGIPAQEYGSPEEAMGAFGEGPLSPMDLPEPEVDEPYLERFDPRTLLVDPSCTDWTLHGARYVFRHKRVLLSKLKRSKYMSNTGTLKGTAYAYTASKDTTEEPQDRSKNVDADDIMLVDVYDGYTYLDVKGKDTLCHIIFCEENSKELLCRETEYPYFKHCLNEFPYVVKSAEVGNNDSADMTCDVESVRDLQTNHDRAYTQIEWARGHTPNILLTATGTFDGEDGAATKKRIEAGVENTGLEVDPAFLPYVKWLDRPELHADAYKSLEDTPNKILHRIGVSEFQGNITPDKRMTATEAGAISQQGSVRQDAQVEAYFDFIVECGYKFLILLQQFTMREKRFAFMGQDGSRQYGTTTPEQLRGVDETSTTPDNPLPELLEPGIQFALDLDAARKRSRNEEEERNQLIQLLPAIAPFAQIPDPRLPTRAMVDMPTILRAMISRFKIPGIDKAVPPDPTPEELQAYTQQKLQAAEAQLNTAADAIVHENATGQQAQQISGEQAAAEQGDKQADRQQAYDLAVMKNATGGKSGNGG
jgi:hypothetical protein